MGNHGGHKVKKRRVLLFLCIVAITVLLNIAAWNSKAFCDWYIANIFPVWVNTYGRFTGLFPFSVGEWLILAGVLLMALAALLLLPWGIIEIVRAVAVRRTVRKEGQIVCGEETLEPGKDKGKEVVADKPGMALKFFRRFYVFFVWTLLSVCLVMTLNCFILYHASTFSERYFGNADGTLAGADEYTLEELMAVYNRVAEQCLRLSEEIARDENGRALYMGSAGRDGRQLDMADKARELMAMLGETYEQLDGYYPRPKALLSSDFMCQQYMCGYYFPFSMEANYNDVMYVPNKPSTMCHELAHLRGFIYEDEANFIAYLACVESDDAFFQYAGYLSVLSYLYNDLYRAWKADPQAYQEAAKVMRPIAVTDQVWEDDTFVMPEEWDRINEKALIDTEVVDQASDVFIDTSLKVNGISDGSVSYSRVVKLLLQYYRIAGE